jgi:hypothetical protein
MNKKIIFILIVNLFISNTNIFSQNIAGIVIQVLGKACIFQNNESCTPLKTGDKLIANSKINVEEGSLVIFDYSSKKRVQLPVGKFIAEYNDASSDSLVGKLDNLGSLQIRDTSVRSSRGDCKPDPELFKNIFGDLPYLKYRGLYCPVLDCLTFSEKSSSQNLPRLNVIQIDNNLPKYSYYTNFPTYENNFSKFKIVVLGDTKCYTDDILNKYNSAKSAIALVNGNEKEYQLSVIIQASEDQIQQLNIDLKNIEKLKNLMEPKDFTDLRNSIYEDHKFYYDVYKTKK